MACSQKKSPFPNNKNSLLDFAARFVSLVRHDYLDNELQPLNLRINTIKDVTADILFSYSILPWVIGKKMQTVKIFGLSDF